MSSRPSFPNLQRPADVAPVRLGERKECRPVDGCRIERAFDAEEPRQNALRSVRDERQAAVFDADLLAVLPDALMFIRVGTDRRLI